MDASPRAGGAVPADGVEPAGVVGVTARGGADRKAADYRTKPPKCDGRSHGRAVAQVRPGVLLISACPPAQPEQRRRPQRDWVTPHDLKGRAAHERAPPRPARELAGSWGCRSRDIARKACGGSAQPRERGAAQRPQRLLRWGEARGTWRRMCGARTLRPPVLPLPSSRRAEHYERVLALCGPLRTTSDIRSILV